MPLHNKQILKTIFCLFLAMFLSYGPISSIGRTSGDKPWHKLETKHAIIYYHASDDLIEFDNNIKFSSLNTVFSSSSTDTGDMEEKLYRKVDAIYKRVQTILDMRKKVKNKVKIRIYQDKAQLHDAFFKIYRKESKLRGWYIYEFNTIYLNMKDLHEGMLAHEMAHSIIDHYLSVRPPKATAEILARYVDKHLVKRKR
jgi:hypothetical protein